MKRVFISFCGKFNRAIGPVKSMNVIFDLLCDDHMCTKSGNLVSTKTADSSVVKKYRATLSSHSLKSLTKKYLSPLIDLFYVFKFNLSIVLNIWTYDVVIITNPFVIIPLWVFNKKLIYTRRANITDRELIANSATKRVFERIFYRVQRYKVVFLVPQPDDSCFIPNSYDIPAVNPCNYVTVKDVFFAGTWSTRKGSRHMEYLLKRGVIEKITAFGVIDQVIPEGVIHKGIVENPSQFYRPGDIYLSLSSLEGLQRSVIEALIAGCFVICLARPDSIFLTDSPLVFVVDDIENVEACLQSIELVTPQGYRQMYLKNYDFLFNNFSHERVRRKWLELI